jgi:alkylation response protein AidB-like acyl-CoA dehydrogenase
MWITNGASANLVALLARTPAENERDVGRAHQIRPSSGHDHEIAPWKGFS